MLAETSTSAIAYFYVFSMSSVIALASAIFMAVNAYLNKNLEQKTASFYSEKAMRMSHTLKSSKNLTAEFTTIGTASLKNVAIKVFTQLAIRESPEYLVACLWRGNSILHINQFAHSHNHCVDNRKLDYMAGVNALPCYNFAM